MDNPRWQARWGGRSIYDDAGWVAWLGDDGFGPYLARLRREESHAEDP